MSRSTELWEIIETKITEEKLLAVEELSKLEARVLSNRVTEEDWSTAILNSQCKDTEND